LYGLPTDGNPIALYSYATRRIQQHRKNVGELQISFLVCYHSMSTIFVASIKQQQLFREIQKSEVLERVKQIRNDDFDWIDREFEWHLNMSSSNIEKMTFQVLNRGFPTERKSVIQSVDNMKKNRFMDVLPYDDNRVKIENHHSDYINASFIDGYDVKRNFIATQGPIGHNETNQGKRESTLEDFWMMLWEQSVQCVVMLTECVENLRLKCAQYWPDEVGAECHYGKVSVRLARSYCCDDICTLREMRVSYEGNTRMVTQWHYKEWQDCKGPQDARHLIKFIRRVRHENSPADSTTSERSSIEDRYDYMNTTSTSNTLTQIVINA
uniref:FI18312p1 (inferred by orthology to a D. melanogaster protein) n=1 Tax=Anisakis simplex TaxID=6269 RepID=A0A0M3K7J4_ANISI